MAFAQRLDLLERSYEMGPTAGVASSSPASRPAGLLKLSCCCDLQLLEKMGLAPGLGALRGLLSPRAGCHSKGTIC